MPTHRPIYKTCLVFVATLAAAMSTSSVVAAAGGPSTQSQPLTQPATKTGGEISGAAVYKKTFVSPSYEIDGIYRSMKGPQSYGMVAVGEPSDQDELLWITAHYTEIVQGDSEAASSPEFMCHSNLIMRDNEEHTAKFGSSPRQRLFTLSQGQMEVRFPEGFGIPVMANKKMQLGTQVLNLNAQPDTFAVRHRGSIEYVRQSDLKTPMKPLLVLSAQGMVAVDASARHYGEAEANPEEHGPGCSVGAPAGNRGFLGPQGGKFVAHWVVKPGREENRTLVTNWMKVPFDTSVHYIAVHLHPFAESASLFDLTDNSIVFRSAASGPTDRIGLTSVESFSSKEGLPLFEGHEYELDSVYNNTTNVDQDSMAVMFIYVLDKNFKLPSHLAVN